MYTYRMYTHTRACTHTHTYTHTHVHTHTEQNKGQKVLEHISSQDIIAFLYGFYTHHLYTFVSGVNRMCTI